MTTDTSDRAVAPPAAATESDPRSAARGRRASDRLDAGESAPRAGRGRLIAWVPLALAAALAAAALWFVQDRLARVERDFARRVQTMEVRDQQSEQQLKQLGDTLRDAQAKAAVLEAKLADSLGQQSQLRQLYDEMARNRGDLMLADVENSIMIAAQQLQLGGNVQSALLAMQDAESVLARSNQPAMIGLRRVLTRDIERLKALPIADFSAAVNRLDAVIGLLEQMPMLADIQSAQAASSTTPADGEARAGLRGLPERMARSGQQGWAAFVAELRQLIRVQRVDEPDALLLSPDQRLLARETLRLQLLNARLNLLARNETLFRGDLARAASTIDRWFDGRHKTVAAAQAALRQLQATRLAIELPSLSDSIAAVRSARAVRDER